MKDQILISATWFLLGVFQLIIYFIERKNQYLSISEERIKRITLFFSKSLKISEIKKVTRFRYSYSVETEIKKLSIGREIIASDSKKDLESFFDSLKLNYT
ncbi:hypothetical protein [Gramella sp. AN32]|uniref:ATP synthase F0 subunit 8 n=1 Tax=Christiangramia antarctica TaxID=2058158 RepID=A0ABW5X0L3_9FLAO|nr:hypothetical protein [Gramella sp. AN32]MCM4155215.1 hypothetical protein [Gramella sp. AN32]